MRRVADDASDRLADAAQLLMDAAREVSKNSPYYRHGEANLESTFSLAVQGLFYADHWIGRPSERTVATDDVQAMFKGLGAGIGVCLASIEDPAGQVQALETFGGALLTAGAQRAEQERP